jgi:3-oxoacyl-(acyl-carrier-protein) synthase/thioesterase domain-containing protein
MSQTRNGLEIALVGMACRYPGADDPDGFWANLAAGVESIRFFSPTELLAAGVDPKLIQHPDYVPAKGVLAGLDQFDAGLFGYAWEQAALLEPQARLLLECAWAALSDAGRDPRRLAEPVGVYLGGEPDPRWLARGDDGWEAGRWVESLIRDQHRQLASLLAERLDLRGPALTLGGGGAASLAAIHLACQGLLAGDCGLALAGGISISPPHQVGYLLGDGLPLSRDGHCRPFAAQASGTVFSDGLGLVVLKRLEDALSAGDGIYAVIKGSALNNAGRRLGGSDPADLRGQTEVVRTALEAAEVDPESLGLVEGHGAGVAREDAVEVRALTRAFNSGRRGFCRLGSVKGNLGHLFSAAGVAGLMKVALALDHRLVPPSLHCAPPHPDLELATTPFLVNSAPWSWRTAPGAPPRRAGVNAFGRDGANVHAVLEEAPAAGRRCGRPRLAPPVFSRRHFPLPAAGPLPIRSTPTLAAPDLPGQSIIELRGGVGETLVCFPDILGRGLVFLGLASLVPDWRVLTLNYQPGPDLVAQTLAALLAADLAGPPTFLAYSAGAFIALAVTRELEARGRAVRRLIFLDAYRPTPALLDSPARLRELKEWLFSALAQHLAAEGDALDLAPRRAWYDRCLGLAAGAPVAADIHLITAQDRETSELFQDWSAATSGGHHIHHGSGSHLEMLRHPFVKDNHRILMSIMTKKQDQGGSWS